MSWTFASCRFTIKQLQPYGSACSSEKNWFAFLKDIGDSSLQFFYRVAVAESVPHCEHCLNSGWRRIRARDVAIMSRKSARYINHLIHTFDIEFWPRESADNTSAPDSSRACASVRLQTPMLHFVAVAAERHRTHRGITPPPASPNATQRVSASPPARGLRRWNDDWAHLRRTRQGARAEISPRSSRRYWGLDDAPEWQRLDFFPMESDHSLIRTNGSLRLISQLTVNLPPYWRPLPNCDDLWWRCVSVWRLY